jgi:energy-coupling factor transporter ATP-binding protein EcfA2
MDDTLHAIVQGKLSAEGVVHKNWAGLILAACDGPDSLERLLRAEKTTQQRAPAAAQPPPVGAYLSSLTVQGFRGIGPKTSISFNPGPGLTLVVGRNGSGKSSFAEALEVLFTGESKRWAGRSKIWKEGWRNLHLGHPTEIQAGLLMEGQGPLTVTAAWAKDAALEDSTVVVQPKSKPKTSLTAMGWSRALVSYRPFLSYNELGSMLDEGPSKLYDALSLVLGLEDLVGAQDALAKSRLARQQAFDSADREREAHIEQL